MFSQVTTDTEFSNSFSFVQMNFWTGRLYYPIKKFFDRELPDILSAQEMLVGPIDLSPDSWTSSTFVDKGYFKNVILNDSRPIMTRHGHPFDMHCAIFTKAEIQIDSENRIALYQDKNDQTDEEKYIARYYSLLHVTIRLQDGIKVHILNHHGRVVKGMDARIKSDIADYNFSRIAEYISTLSGPIILSGDFNLWKEASSLLPLKRVGLTNLNDVYNISSARNEFAWLPGEAVSHIFINDQVDVINYRVAQDNVSDHLPLVMTCRVRI